MCPIFFPPGVSITIPLLKGTKHLPHPVRIMAILNMTPDSFSDGGQCLKEGVLQAKIERLIADGADIIDIGGESTRPFSRPVSALEEMARILPAVRMVRRYSDLPISIDTSKASVAQAALDAGADIINDISALRGDKGMLALCQQYEGPVILMHMQGEPGSMQRAPAYTDVVAEVVAFFDERIAWVEAQGIDRQRIVLDPGLGFGKTLEHNLSILRNLKALQVHGCPLLIGHSRKSFLGELLDIPVEERDCPTAVLAALCAWQGVDILRVHNVHLARQAVQLASACWPDEKNQFGKTVSSLDTAKR